MEVACARCDVPLGYCGRITDLCQYILIGVDVASYDGNVDRLGAGVMCPSPIFQPCPLQHRSLNAKEVAVHLAGTLGLHRRRKRWSGKEIFQQPGLADVHKEIWPDRSHCKYYSHSQRRHICWYIFFAALLAENPQNQTVWISPLCFMKQGPRKEAFALWKSLKYIHQTRDLAHSICWS